MPFEKGNKHGANSKQFQKRMRAAIEQDNWERVRQGIERVLNECAQGERWAIELVRDTLDGRPAQQIQATDNEGKPLAIALIAYSEEEHIDAGHNDPIQVSAQVIPDTGSEGPGTRH